MPISNRFWCFPGDSGQESACRLQVAIAGHVHKAAARFHASLLLLRYAACMLSRFSSVLLSATPRKVARQISLSIGFSRQVYWSGLPFPPSENLSHPGIEPGSPAASAFQGDSLSQSHWGGLGKFLLSPCKLECCVALVVKNLPANARRHKRLGFNSYVGKILWRRKTHSSIFVCEIP